MGEVERGAGGAQLEQGGETEGAGALQGGLRVQEVGEGEQAFPLAGLPEVPGLKPERLTVKRSGVVLSYSF